jgi:hypothetical protein
MLRHRVGRLIPVKEMQTIAAAFREASSRKRPTPPAPDRTDAQSLPSIDGDRPALRRNDLEIGKVSAGCIADPDTNQSLLAVAELGDDQAGLFCVADENAHLRTCHNETGMEPGVRIRHGFDGLFVMPRTVCSQLLPRMSGMGDVLHGAKDPCGVFSLEVKRTEVDRVVSRAIDAMKRHTDEAGTLNVLALHIQLDGAVGEFDSRQIYGPFAFSFTQANTFSGAVSERGDGPFERIQALPLGKDAQIGHERFRLPSNPGGSVESDD